MWDPVHRRAAEILALGWDPGGPDLRLIADRSEPARVERLALDGDYDVAPPDLDDRYNVTIDDAGVSA